MQRSGRRRCSRRGKRDEEHPAPVGKEDAVCLGSAEKLGRIHSGPGHVSPESHNVQVQLPLSAHQWRELVLCQAYLDSVHCLEGSNQAAVADG